MSWRERIAERLFGDIITARVENAVKVIDDEYWTQVYGGPPTLDETGHNTKRTWTMRWKPGGRIRWLGALLL